MKPPPKGKALLEPTIQRQLGIAYGHSIRRINPPKLHDKPKFRIPKKGVPREVRENLQCNRYGEFVSCNGSRWNGTTPYAKSWVRKHGEKL